MPTASAALVRVTLGPQNVGFIRIENRGRPISPQEIAVRVAQDLNQQVLHLAISSTDLARATNLAEFVLEQIVCDDDLSCDVFIPRLASVVIASRNRPEQLRRCLESLSRQSTLFPFEVVVVDNDPDSGLTQPVVESFHGVRYVAESTKGLSAARNTGFRAAHGEILVATDDDVVAPPGWLHEVGLLPVRMTPRLLSRHC